MGSKNSGSDNTRMPRAMGAIANNPSRQEGENVSVNPNQPRQPSNLQDLLRFSMEARTQGQSGSQVLPMDEERKKWLDNALKYMTTDVIQILLQAIDLLKNAGSLSVNDDPKEYEEALETVSGCVENLDVANDFHKIGGFTVFEPCLHSCHPSLQWKAANVIAELTQNNPYCQERAIEMDFLPMLLKLLDQSHNELTRVKSLYAISCILRDNPKALHTFAQHDGFSVLLRSMQSRVEKLKTKSSFLLTSLCSQTPEIIDSLCSMGFVEQLAALVVQQQQPGFSPDSSSGGRSLEHLLSALLTLIRDHERAQSACRRPELGLRRSLEYHLQSISGKDEFREEGDYCHELLKVVFSGDPEEEER
ncbi:hsp70-binding protein 1-like [Ischnura elegans]|uniref:hsp70-binding protein 1-like n=1 Tax=Ischnura elegans TaxID=197161 RepID=UPI001ED8B628|nr:hsp70-binding protein 1-like [Ischnura elegans]